MPCFILFRIPGFILLPTPTLLLLASQLCLFFKDQLVCQLLQEAPLDLSQFLDVSPPLPPRHVSHLVPKLRV